MRGDVLIARATRRLEAAGSPTPRLDAEVLAMAAMKVDRTWLYTWGDKPMATLARARFEAWRSRGGGPGESHDTVASLALDWHGRLAGACSTSGSAWK